jgi:hypothetical protein
LKRTTAGEERVPLSCGAHHYFWRLPLGRLGFALAAGRREPLFADRCAGIAITSSSAPVSRADDSVIAA